MLFWKLIGGQLRAKQTNRHEASSRIGLKELCICSEMGKFKVDDQGEAGGSTIHKRCMIDELFSNCFDLVWRIAMAISGYDIGVRTTRQRVLETPCLTRHFQRDAPQNRRQRRQNFLLDKWCTSLLGPVQGVLCTLPSKKAALLAQDSGLRSQVSTKTCPYYTTVNDLHSDWHSLPHNWVTESLSKYV